MSHLRVWARIYLAAASRGIGPADLRVLRWEMLGAILEVALEADKDTKSGPVAGDDANVLEEIRRERGLG